ncbi:MAG: hypothetical protein HZB11_02315 [Candidatus Yonathbacteria bacterium]|nr:hypothetical protein [Candidatus Yonathbacteria bacterium]
MKTLKSRIVAKRQEVVKTLKAVGHPKLHASSWEKGWDKGWNKDGH